MDHETREAIKAFLRENLSVEISIDTNWDSMSSSKRAEVKLLLDGEEIASDSCSFDVGRN